MFNYNKNYSVADMDAIVFGKANGHGFKIIAESMGRTEQGVKDAFKRALRTPLWKNTFNQYRGIEK